METSGKRYVTSLRNCRQVARNVGRQLAKAQAAEVPALRLAGRYNRAIISLSWVKKPTFWSKLRARGGRIIYACARNFDKEVGFFTQDKDIMEDPCRA